MVVNGRALAFALGAATLTALLVGILPALYASRTAGRLMERLRSGATASVGSSGERRARNALVSLQFALAFTLLLGAGLLIQSVRQVLSASLGYDPGNLVAFNIAPGKKYDTHIGYGVSAPIAIGDVSVVTLPGRFKPDAPPLVLPKAGVMADAEGKVVAANISAKLAGRSASKSFEGKGFCYIEMGDMHAIRGDGNFFDMPNPTMGRKVPDMQQYQDKRRWISGWLKEHWLV